MRPCRSIQAVGLSLCVVAQASGQAVSLNRDDQTGVTKEYDQSSSAEPAENEQATSHDLLKWLPPAISDQLEFDAWGWAGVLHNSEGTTYWDLELSLAITKTFDQRLTISAQGNFIDANGTFRAELGQGYASWLLSEDMGTILTLGKFNANFGVEGRDFWNRRTGTTSLLFGAQPQDIVGAMLTQPLGDGDLKLRPFISADFQGAFYFDQPPAGGVMLEYRPSSQWELALTNWVGPGVVLYGGVPLNSPYPGGSYGTDAAAVVANWQGPNLVGQRAGTLYFVEAKAVWQALPDLQLAAEFLMATTWSSTGRWGWHGWMLLADYDVTNRVHVYGRFSYLDDSDWLVTGFFQTRREISCGFGCDLYQNIEVRGEYRHDFSNSTSDVDSISLHLTFTY